jgi:hypothetical protein
MTRFLMVLMVALAVLLGGGSAFARVGGMGIMPGPSPLGMIFVPGPIPPLWPIIHEPGGGPNTHRRVRRSGLRQIHTFPSGLGVASSNGTNSVSRTTQPLPVTAKNHG